MRRSLSLWKFFPFQESEKFPWKSGFNKLQLGKLWKEDLASSQTTRQCKFGEKILIWGPVKEGFPKIGAEILVENTKEANARRKKEPVP